MKYLLSGVAIAALLAAALPATAQATKDTSSNPAASAPSSSGKHAGHKSTARTRRGAQAEETSADDLNRRELERIAQTGSPATAPGVGTTRAPAPAAPQQ